jgi:hypothetical protein
LIPETIQIDGTGIGGNGAIWIPSTSGATTFSGVITTNTAATSEINNLGRVIFNNIPYIIDSVQNYRIPSRSERQGQVTNNNYSSLLQRFFQPIEIFPTQPQIEAATRNVRYCDILNPINRSCPISLENFSDSDYVTVIRYCGHIFNRNELNTWFRSNCRCPVCRYDIRNYSSNPNFFDLSGNVSRDTSNNLIHEEDNTYEENIDNDEIERSIVEPINNNPNITSNNSTSYFDLFFSDNFSALSDVTDPQALVNLLRALQRNNR